MSSVSDSSEWKVNILNDPVLYRGSYQNFKPPHAMVYRIVLWEKPYVAKWFRQAYRTSLAPTAMIAYSRYILHGMYGIPDREWSERNMPLIAFIHLYNSILLSEVMMRKFPDEFEWATRIWETRCNQINLVKSTSQEQVF